MRRDHLAQVLAHEVWVLTHRFVERAEDDTQLLELCAEGRFHRDAIHDRIDRHIAREHSPLVEWYAKLVKGLFDLRIYGAVSRSLVTRSRIVYNVLIVYLRD